MVTIKRYIGKIRKPLHWKGRKAFLRFAVLPALLAVALLLAVRMMVVTQYEMPYNRYDLDLLQGDRLAVNRLAYGWTTPLPRLFGEHHIGECLPKKGDLVAFASPAGNDQVLVERVEALPGDTVVVETLLRDGQEMVRRFVVCKGYGQFGNYIVPLHCVIGRVFGITYSVDPQAPFYRCFRRERFLLKTDD